MHFRIKCATLTLKSVYRFSISCSYNAVISQVISCFVVDKLTGIIWFSVSTYQTATLGPHIERHIFIPILYGKVLHVCEPRSGVALICAHLFIKIQFSEIYCDKIDIDFDYFTNLILPCLFLGLAAFGIFGNLIIIILLLIQKLKKAVDVLVLNLGFG